jgi:hypothetical protein
MNFCILLRHIYRISLEAPIRWPFWFGLPVNESSFDSFTIDLAMSYFSGLQSAVAEILAEADDLTPFFTWLRDERDAFPTRGWCAQFLDKCNGNHFAALQKLFDYLDEYLLLMMPSWFLELNHLSSSRMFRERRRCRDKKELWSVKPSARHLLKRYSIALSRSSVYNCAAHILALRAPTNHSPLRTRFSYECASTLFIPPKLLAITPPVLKMGRW